MFGQQIPSQLKMMNFHFSMFVQTSLKQIYEMYDAAWCRIKQHYGEYYHGDTVDARNSAPPGIYKTLKILG